MLGYGGRCGLDRDNGTRMTAFLLTWKAGGWPHENIERMLGVLNQQRYVDEPWRIHAHRMAKSGDRVWLLKQGRGPKGIFGVGEIIGQPTLGDAGSGKKQMMAPVRFTSLVDPKQSLLIGEDDTKAILSETQLRAQASGYPLADKQAEALESVLSTGSVVDLGGSGDWTPAELRAITSDYFAMLTKELAGEKFSKTEHRNTLQNVVSRSNGSIERKHQNISAVLHRLGIEWITGYKPLGNYQDALVDVIEAQLDQRAEGLEFGSPSSATPTTAIDPKHIFVDPPSKLARTEVERSIARVIRKFDPAQRDAANRQLGEEGERFVLHLERSRLVAAGQAELAEKVAWVSKEIGDGLGYDIESYEEGGRQIYIEVKTTKGPIDTPFFLTENERRVAAEKAEAYRLYRLFNFVSETRAFVVSGPLDENLSLTPVSYRARFKPRN